MRAPSPPPPLRAPAFTPFSLGCSSRRAFTSFLRAFRTRAAFAPLASRPWRACAFFFPTRHPLAGRRHGLSFPLFTFRSFVYSSRPRRACLGQGQLQSSSPALSRCICARNPHRDLISGRLSFVTRATVRLSRTRPHPIGMRHTPHPASQLRGTVELRLRPRLALLL